MLITWLGHSFFKIQDKTGTDGITIATDPYGPSIGLKPSRFEADILTVSHAHDDHSFAEAIRGETFTIREAGEYDVKGVSIIGIETWHDSKEGRERGSNIAFWFEVDGISVLHLGDLGGPLTDKQLGKIPSPHILLLPVGGTFTLDARAAVEVMNQLEPRIVIPMRYQLPGLKIKLDGVEKFIKESGLKPHEEEKLKISKKDLPSEDTELVVLKI
jgi:L-ascorbate metabolism protein UlaG (beta-lactamase superfamily)